MVDNFVDKWKDTNTLATEKVQTKNKLILKQHKAGFPVIFSDCVCVSWKLYISHAMHEQCSPCYFAVERLCKYGIVI